MKTLLTLVSILAVLAGLLLTDNLQPTIDRVKTVAVKVKPVLWPDARNDGHGSGALVYAQSDSEESWDEAESAAVPAPVRQHPNSPLNPPRVCTVSNTSTQGAPYLTRQQRREKLVEKKREQYRKRRQERQQLKKKMRTNLRTDQGRCRSGGGG